MKVLALVALAVVSVAAKPSGVLHSHPLVYSSPLQQTIVSEDLGAIHHQIFPGAIVAGPQSVVHKTVVSDLPSIAHQHSSFVHQYNSPAVVHKSIVQPALHAYVAESPAAFVHQTPAVIHHEAAPAVVHSSIIGHDALISAPKAVVVEEPRLSIVQKSHVLSEPATVSGVISPLVHHHHALVGPAVLKNTIATESVGVKHTVSSQASSIIHPPSALHEVPIVQNTIVQPALPISTQYTFGYLPAVSTEVQSVEKTEVAEEKPSVSIKSDSAVEAIEPAAEDLSSAKLEKAEVVSNSNAAALAAKAAFDANVKSAGFQEVAASAALLPSGYSYAYVAQQPLIKAAYVQPEPLLSHVEAVIPGITLTAAGVPVETPEVIQAKAAHLAALRGLQAKDEKPCD